MVGDINTSAPLPGRLPGIAEILNRVGGCAPPPTFQAPRTFYTPTGPQAAPYKPQAPQQHLGVYKPRHIVPRATIYTPRIQAIQAVQPPRCPPKEVVIAPPTQPKMGCDGVQVRRFERENKNGPWLDTGLKHTTEYEKLKMYTVTLSPTQLQEVATVHVKTFEEGTPVDSRGVPAQSQSRYLLSLNESFSDSKRDLEFTLTRANPSATFYVKPHFVAVVPRKNYKRAVIEVGAIQRDGRYVTVCSNSAQIKSRKPQVRRRRNPRKEYVEARRDVKSRAPPRQYAYDSDDEEVAAYGLAHVRLRAVS